MSNKNPEVAQPKPIVPDGMASYPSWRYHESGKSEVVNNPDRDAAMATEGGWADAPFPKKDVPLVVEAKSGASDSSVLKQLESRITNLESKVADQATQIADLDGLVNESLAEKTAPDAPSKKSTK